MASYETPQYVSAALGSTQLKSTVFRFVRFGSSGDRRVVIPAAAGAVDGVIVSESTGLGGAVQVQIAGIAQVEALASTISRGDIITTTTAGKIKANVASGTDRPAGKVVAGTSGTTGRIMSVLLKCSPCETTGA